MQKVISRLKRAYKLADNNQGVALVVVMIIGAVVMAFCLSMLLVAYTFFAQTSRQTTQLRCRILAQSYSEVLGEEFNKKSEDSELLQYLGENIREKKWIAVDSEADSDMTGTTEELVLAVDQSTSNIAVGYTITTTFTYEDSDDADDDNESGIIDDDDEDTKEPSEGEESSNPENPEDVGGTYLVTAVIKCVRGNDNDRDVQEYTIERQFTLNVLAKSGE